MPRKEKDVSIDSTSSRDHGKRFHIKEMSTYQSERWAFRAILALTKQGVEIPDEIIADPTLAGIAYMGVRQLGKLDELTALSLLDEMMGCVTIIPDPDRPEFRRAIVEGDDGDIEELPTRLKLRMEVVSIHLGFSVADGLSSYMERASAMAKTKISQRGKTSRRQSRR